jgi:hypothetical protein
VVPTFVQTTKTPSTVDDHGSWYTLLVKMMSSAKIREDLHTSKFREKREKFRYSYVFEKLQSNVQNK